jgi:aldehyde dehydrogenase (NAD+)
VRKLSAEHYLEIYLAGGWQQSAGTTRIRVVNPATEATIAEVIEGTPGDVDLAARAARKAWPSWAELAPPKRAEWVAAIAEALEPYIETIARLETQEVGTPIARSREVHARGPVETLRSIARVAADYPWTEQVGRASVVRSPVGVVGQITPWNFPLHQIVQKLGPALVAGCTVVLKPSEVAPLTAYLLADAIDQAGLPPGVFNMVSGSGPVVGEAIAAHPEIDMVSFTGSTRAGKRVAALAVDAVKRVTLEMGGKSASVILSGANLYDALPASVERCFSHSGQVCAAWSRLLVPRGQHDEIVARVRELADRTTVGDPMSSVDLGPLVSEVQRDRVRDYIAAGIEEGATLVTGGADSPDGLADGYYVRPTVFANVQNQMKIAQEEIFGPVLCIIPYDSEEDAIRIANETIYGLSGAVWADDPARGEQFARRMRTGSVTVNGGAYARGTPHGGFKQSGIGRESGRFGIDEYVELQTINAAS